MVNTVVIAILSALGGSLFTLVLGFVTGLWGYTKAFIKAVKATTHDALFRQGRSIVAHGNITESELENLDFLFDAYHGLKMNGTGEKLYEKCRDLPLLHEERS